MKGIVNRLLMVFVIALFVVNCNENHTQNQENKRTTDSSDLVKNDSQSIHSIDTSGTINSGSPLELTSNSTFKKFSLNFSKRNLPYELQIGDSDWIKFTPSDFKEIHRDTAIKYLCENDTKKVLDPKGGYYRYYYGYRIAIHDTLVGLLYFRSSSEYSGYILSLFGEKGKLLNEIFLAGTKGEYNIEAQKESKLYEDGSIEIKEIVLSKDAVGKSEPYDAKIRTTRYEISASGKIKPTQDSTIVSKSVFQDKDRYRVYEKK